MTAVENENVIKSPLADLPKTPERFSDLKKEALVFVADHFGSDTEGTKEAVIASLVEDGVQWEQVAEAFGWNKREAKPEQSPNDFSDLKKELEDMSNELQVTAPPVEEKAIVAEPEILRPSSKYLIKMERENPLFQWRNYRFTEEKPFAILTAEDAQELLTSEQGFRQAFPSELEEYYS